MNSIKGGITANGQTLLEFGCPYYTNDCLSDACTVADTTISGTGTDPNPAGTRTGVGCIGELQETQYHGCFL
ncbi:hypothetical protein GTQ40_17760 [Flavobacteriaceae bacterium R38]|nr:hypothetical protein [Flavobacteriaceae bacterium R38]